MIAVELRVIVKSSDDRDGATERLESIVRRALGREFDPGLLYVEAVKP